MQNCDYPEFVTCHVRDPRVWKEGDRYYMIQGARTKEDKGTALLFVSSDKENWTYSGQITTREKFGCMWECPEYLKIGRRKVLPASLQGVTGGEWKMHAFWSWPVPPSAAGVFGGPYAGTRSTVILNVPTAASTSEFPGAREKLPSPAATAV